MNTVTTINLAGAAFQVEDPGYTALKNYLDDAKAALEGNPDRDEIIADMERAMADKCRAYLSAHKNVVSADEAAKIVADMGPVSTGDAGTAPRKPKRLYRIVEGEMVAGVASGLAVYFDIDVTLVRILMVVLLAITGGGFVFGYLLAWIFIPPAQTADQRAAAYGTPRTAQEIINQAKTEYARFAARVKEGFETGHDAHLKWKTERDRMRTQWKAHRRAMRDEWHAQRAHYQRGPSIVGQLVQLIVVTFLLWLAYHHVAIAHEFMDAAWNTFMRVVNALAQAIAAH